MKIAMYYPISIVLNTTYDVIARVFVTAYMPVTREPNGLLVTDKKRPDGSTLLPWYEMSDK
jgi:hypothetical protein